MTELKTLSRRCWTLVRKGLRLPPTRVRFERRLHIGRKVGDHHRVRGRAVLLNEHLWVEMKPGDDSEALFAALVARLQILRPFSCGPLKLPILADHAYRMVCARDSLSIRVVRTFILWPVDGGEPGMRTRFDVLVATTPDVDVAGAFDSFDSRSRSARHSSA